MCREVGLKSIDLTASSVERRLGSIVMAGLVPVIQPRRFDGMSDIVSDCGSGLPSNVSILAIGSNTWLAGTSPAMTLSEVQVSPDTLKRHIVVFHVKQVGARNEI